MTSIQNKRISHYALSFAGRRNPWLETNCKYDAAHNGGKRAVHAYPLAQVLVLGTVLHSHPLIQRS